MNQQRKPGTRIEDFYDPILSANYFKSLGSKVIIFDQVSQKTLKSSTQFIQILNHLIVIFLILSIIISAILTNLILFENQRIIILLKSMGYRKGEVEWYLIGGYLIATLFAVGTAIGLSVLIFELTRKILTASNANLPQILTKAGLKAMIYWRGINQKQLEKGVFNNWTGIDGTVIPTYNMFKYGYGTGAEPLFDHFGQEWEVDDIPQLAKIYLENAEKEILPMLEKVSINTGNIILIPFGNDQIPIFKGYQELVDNLNKIDDNHEWVLSDYDTFIKDVIDRTEMQGLGNIEGELRFGQFSRVHKTITSSRYDIKWLGKHLEYLIYNITEPLALMYENAGGQYPSNIIEVNLKKLLECQAHDSAGACNTDETNRSIIERLNSGIDALESLNNLMTRRILESYNIQNNDLAIFNLKPYQRELHQELTIFTKSPSFEIINEQGLSVPFTIRDQKYSAGQINNFKVTDNVQFKDVEYKLDKEKGVYWTKIAIDVKKIDGLSFKIFKVKEIDKKLELTLVKQETLISNDYFTIKVYPFDGTIELVDHQTNKIIKDAFSLTSQADAGDSYDFSPSKTMIGENSQLVQVKSETFESNNEKTLRLHYWFKISDKLDSHNLINQYINLDIILKDNQIKLKIDMDNQAKDVKWNLNCKTGIKAKTSFSDTAFGIIERPISIPEMKVWKKEKWIDCPIEIEAMESVCWLQKKDESYAVTVKGNNEYQIIDKDTISLTLFRGYSEIGRNDLAYRIGRASGVDIYPHHTPDANLNKPLHFEFNIIINQLDNLVRIAKDNATQSYYYQKQNIQPYWTKGDRLVTFKNRKKFSQLELFGLGIDLPKNLVISSFKKAHDDHGYVLRIYNPSFEKVIFKTPRHWKELNLMEIVISNQTTFKPNEVRTFWIKEV